MVRLCPKCGGKGEVETHRDFERHHALCSNCNGHGIIEINANDETRKK